MNKPNFEVLQKNCEERLEQLIFEVDQLYKSLEQIEKSKMYLKKINVSLSVVGFENLIKYRLFLGIVSMDLCVAILIHCKSKSSYENMYSARQIIVIINESYKKIYNFLSVNEFGDVIRKYRNNSYWIKEIGFIITNELPDLKSEYDLITFDLDEYLKINFEALQVQRNLSIHYDKDPIKVYKMLIDLDVEEIYKLLIPFNSIINKMYKFTEKLKIAFKKKTESQTTRINQNFEDMAVSLEKLKESPNLEDVSLISDLQAIIREMKQN